MSPPADNGQHTSEPAVLAATIRDQLFHTSKILRSHSGQFVDTGKIKREILAPFLRALGYNFENFAEVIFDFPPDPNFCQRTVDIALLRDAQEVLLVNCTSRQAPFRPIEARRMIWFLEHCTAHIGIITNGLEYRCYSTWGEPRYEPFFEFRLDYTSSRLYEELVWFTKDKIAGEQAREYVEKKRQARKIQQVLVDQYNAPSPDFVRVLMERAELAGEVDPDVVREAFFWLVNNSLNSALIMQVARAKQNGAGSVADSEPSQNGHGQSAVEKGGSGQPPIAAAS